MNATITSNTLQFRDYDGYTLTIPADADGLTTADWGDGFTAAAWYYPAEGALFVPADCQADAAEHVQDGLAVGRWVEATTGDDAVIFDGAPRLI